MLCGTQIPMTISYKRSTDSLNAATVLSVRCYEDVRESPGVRICGVGLVLRSGCQVIKHSRRTDRSASGRIAAADPRIE